MEQNFTRFKKFKELDIFIQNSLDKYFYVEPWKKLYERTGKLHRDIISDKSTIPDLIIYNKTFNKSDCYIGSNEKTFIKFPRKRFILRPKYKKEYNPLSTYGEDDEVYFYIKKGSSQNINNFSSNNKINEEKNINKSEAFLKQNIKTDLNKLLNEQKDEINEKNRYFNNENEEEDEEEPEWANDDVKDYCNSKIEFKAIPKSLEDKMEEDFGNIKEDVNNGSLDNIEKNNIDIDNFFKII